MKRLSDRMSTQVATNSAMKFLLNFNSKQVNQNNLNRDTSTKVPGHHMCAGSYDDRNINLQIAEASNASDC
jgi:hypothetical protein